MPYLLLIWYITDKRKGTLRDWIREERKKDPKFKMKPTKNAPGTSTEGHEDGDIFPGKRSEGRFSLTRIYTLNYLWIELFALDIHTHNK